MFWDITLRRPLGNTGSGDSREIGDITCMDYIVVDRVNEMLHPIEEKYRGIRRELERMAKDIDLDIKEVKRRVKSVAANADKIKGGVENEIGLRSITGQLYKLKLDNIKERGSIIKTAQELILKINQAAGLGAGSPAMGGAGYSNKSNAMDMTQGLYDGVGINKNLFDNQSTPEAMNRKVEQLETITRENIAELANNTEPPVDGQLGKVGLVDYGYSAQNLQAYRQCKEGVAPPNITNVVYVDKKTGLYWPGIEYDNGTPAVGQNKSLKLVLDCEINSRTGSMVDQIGTTCSIKDANSNNMPAEYKEEWRKYKGIDVDNINNSRDLLVDEDED